MFRLSLVFYSASTPNLMFSKALSCSLSDCAMYKCFKWFGLRYRDFVHQPVFRPPINSGIASALTAITGVTVSLISITLGFLAAVFVMLPVCISCNSVYIFWHLHIETKYLLLLLAQLSSLSRKHALCEVCFHGVSELTSR